MFDFGSPASSTWTASVIDFSTLKIIAVSCQYFNFYDAEITESVYLVAKTIHFAG